MNEKDLKAMLCSYEYYLRYEAENGEQTIKKYLSEARKFLEWLYDTNGLTISKIDKEIIIKYKDYLEKIHTNPDTINGKIGMNHIFLKFLGKGNITIKRLKIVKRNCKPSGRYVKEVDYKRLIKCGKKKYAKAVIVAKIIANTGIRASEIGQITYEMVIAGKIIVSNKGKIREVVLNKHIRRDLLKYCKKIGIKTGPVILNNRRNAYTRFGIWRMLKNLAKEMEVDTNTVFPHSFRHLFAVKHYSIHKDIEALANILGHSSTETTLIYLRKTVEEYGITMDIWYKK
ncbi:MAG: tyrosine-type recombinase/integrase [Lachnospiraceae bacterium]|nr:tyrosine-type recombinase/integrase [Lachnospiraceae bacterium]